MWPTYGEEGEKGEKEVLYEGARGEQGQMHLYT